MIQLYGPLIMGSLLLLLGAISFWGRYRLSRMGAKLTASVNANTTYDQAYRRRLRYGYVSGLIFLAAGAGFLIFGVINLVVASG